MNRRASACVVFGMEAHPAIPLEPPAGRLFALARRCLREPASRRLDGEIYCAIHRISDINALSDDSLRAATQGGRVLVKDYRGAEIGWIEAPPFTEMLKYAETLLPEEVTTICRDARRVCATALNARALANTPPPHLSNIFEFCRR